MAKRDALDCGAGRVDTIQRDDADVLDGCENFFLGVSRVKVSGNHVELSWTHPRSWRKLRRLVLYVMEDLGAEGLSARSARCTSTCVTRASRRSSASKSHRGSRMTRRGKTVTARFELEINPAWAGSTFAYELEAVDLRGHPDSHGPLE